MPWKLTRDEWLALLALGVVVLMADSVEWGDPHLWAWPIPDLVIGADVFPAEVSNGFDASAHRGVDLMYRRPTSPLTATMHALPFSAGHDGEERWFEPPGTPVMAARAGLVRSVDLSQRGTELVLDHGPPFATYYQHLATVKVKAGDRVEAGQVIGTAGWDPVDASGPHALRHLHFEVWYKGGESGAVDPARALASWRRTQWAMPSSTKASV
jgi:murein DD-endopeptidase MepM/ murein hydrolase activator NlpD